MKGIFKILSVVILLAALAGAILLVRKNQETRRGAATADTSTQILPDVVSASAGSNFTVDAWLNTGKATDTLTGAEFSVAYDKTKVKFVSAVAQNGYTILNDPATMVVTDANGNEAVSLKMITLGTEKGGAVDVAKLTFTSLGGANSLLVQGAKLMVSGQSTTWDVASNSPSNVNGGGSVVTVAITKVPTSIPTRVPTVVKTIANEGEMCGGIMGIMCNTGLTCKMTVNVGRADGSGTCVKTGTVTPTTGALKCEWCGTGCRAVTPNGGVCAMIAPPAGKSCLPVNGTCTIVTQTTTPTPIKRVANEGEMCGGIAGIVCNTGLTCNYTVNTGKADSSGVCVKSTVVGGSCGQRCTTDAGCAKGMTCTPIWWQCDTLSAGLNVKLQSNQALDKATVDQMISVCPMAASALPAGYAASTTVKMPTFYGVCRNTLCTKSTDCSCVASPSTTPRPITPTIRVVTPTIRTTTPTPTPRAGTPTAVVGNNQVTLMGQFMSTNTTVGSNIDAQILVNSNGMKVSAVNTQVIYNTDYFDFVETIPAAGATVLKNEVDKTTGRVTVYLSWSLPSSQLMTSPVVATIKFKAKLAGIGLFRFDSSYKSEVSGLNNNGVSTGFGVIIPTTTPSVTITAANSCMACSSGPAKSTGNANCDASINSVDFELWRAEMFDQGGLSGTVSSTWKSDFNCDQKVSGVDFEIWRQSVFQ